jgi:hypothetical protein
MLATMEVEPMSHDQSRQKAPRHWLRAATGVLVRGAAAMAIALVGVTSVVGAVQAGAAAAHETPLHAAPHVRHQDAPGFPGTSTTAPFNECPAIGDNTSCGLLVVVSNNGISIQGDPANTTPYEGIEDTVVGIVNNSSKPLYRIQLSSASQPIFGFDGDGICTVATGGSNPESVSNVGYTGDTYCSTDQLVGQDNSPTCASLGNTYPCGDPLGGDYQGPANSFSNINTDPTTGINVGDVDFTGGLQPGAGTYFSLEESLTAGQLGVQFGYWEVAADGGIFAYDAPFFGSMGGKPLVKPVVGIAADPNTGGYWEVAADGGLFAFNAPFEGSMGGKPLVSPIVGMVATPDGLGYWEVGADGGLFAFGDAAFYGSMGGKPLNSAIVGIATTPDGHGYWEVGADGGLFSFGDAVFQGSEGGKPLNEPVVGIAGDQGTGGYWEVASDGGLFAFAAPFFGSPASMPLNKPVVGMASTPDGQGYWEAASDGGIFNYGDAFFWGSTGSITLNSPVVGIAGSQ